MKKAFYNLRHVWFRLLLICFVSSSFGLYGQQQVTVTGTVIENGTDIPIAGAAVFIENTSFGGITDFDGKYTFTATLDTGAYTLLTSYIGFKTNRMPIEIGASTTITNNILLQEDLLSLDEVVVTGNTVGVNKRTLGNAISTVKAEELVNNGAIAVDQAISGKISGALVQQNSGDPAGGISIRLRGPSTVLGNSDPLYIVDGIIFSNSSNQLIDLGGNSQNRLVDLNPNDIERIEIIKGAAAAAIYGSRASNGVVQIFTKAMSIGNLAQNYEQVIVTTNSDNTATFVSGNEGFETAVTLLTEALSELTTNPPSGEFTNAVTLGNIDLENSIRAMQARYALFAGNYDLAISAATSVDHLSTSVFAYDNINLNPVWTRVFQNDAPNFKPRDNFGPPTEFVFDTADGRLAFYLVPLDETNQNGLPIEDLAGFFDDLTKSIPVYLPDEMNLIIAEAQLRKSNPDIAAATTALNEVLTDTDDPFGLNAGLPQYSGAATTDALLQEIYKNRRAELFLTGISLEDSRRFNRPQPSGTSMNYDEERNRNFYPYPDIERNSNPNTPADPSI
ncbi:TonB-dependent receptor [Croceitalea dokdonensis DOKDO 023]|uniref:TonB-dependent receptor n=1 Tax=Croceitalea dokdonensis DOKDO 023 TaxID=1300341 RepID=A0A0P7AUX9_9FLAO|nr:carboxypeptidase-like regulatory domain-containing protein [Croceitalea dokdonensis]KPM31659.1 TonB-dependent receptor [Croceitalea dokdonensis DOKDO 023]